MANLKINDLAPLAISGAMQLETDIAGTQSNKINISDLTTYIVSFVPPSSGITWVTQTTNDNIMPQTGYLTDALSQVILTLPTVIAKGAIFRVANINAGGFRISQNAGQIIRFGIRTTTTGTSGYCASTSVGDALEVLCSVANTEFIVLSSVGNIDVI